MILFMRTVSSCAGGDVQEGFWRYCMTSEIIFTIIESLDGGYEAQAVGHSIFTQSDTYSELSDTLRDAVKCHFDEGQVPSLIRMHFVRDEVIAV